MTTPCIILYADNSDDVIFSGPVWTLPLTNMQDPRVTKVARSADATSANTQFFMAFSSPVALPGLVIVGTNLDVNAQYRITAYSDAGFSIQTFSSGLLNYWTAGGPIVDPDFKGTPLIDLFGSIVTAAYWQIELFNTANADGYVQLGKLFAGTALNLSFGFAENSAFSRDPNTVAQKALNGTPYFSRHPNIRSWSLLFPAQTYENAWDQIDILNELSGLDRPIFVIPFPDDPARMYRQSFLGRLTKMTDLQLLAAQVSTGFQLTEYIG